MDMQGNAVEVEDFTPENYCEHGKFIGNPFGADYMCQWCEEGVTLAEYQQIQMEAKALRRAAAVRDAGVWIIIFMCNRASLTGRSEYLQSSRFAVDFKKFWQDNDWTQAIYKDVLPA